MIDNGIEFVYNPFNKSELIAENIVGMRRRISLFPQELYNKLITKAVDKGAPLFVPADDEKGAKRLAAYFYQYRTLLRKSQQIDLADAADTLIVRVEKINDIWMTGFYPRESGDDAVRIGEALKDE